MNSQIEICHFKFQCPFAQFKLSQPFYCEIEKFKNFSCLHVFFVNFYTINFMNKYISKVAFQIEILTFG